MNIEKYIKNLQKTAREILEKYHNEEVAPSDCVEMLLEQIAKGHDTPDTEQVSEQTASSLSITKEQFIYLCEQQHCGDKKGCTDNDLDYAYRYEFEHIPDILEIEIDIKQETHGIQVNPVASEKLRKQLDDYPEQETPDTEQVSEQTAREMLNCVLTRDKIGTIKLWKQAGFIRSE